MTNTSFLQVIASDENEKRHLARKAAVLSSTRVTNLFGSFIEAKGESALEYLESEIATVVASACEEVGYEDVDGTLATVLADCGKKHENPFAKKDDDDKDDDDDEDGEKKENPFAKDSSVHESRKPKMCPFHKDVVEISLAAGDPRAGFDSMAQHWGGPRHCDGEGYEGGSCKFKAPMTTQSYWDERAEKAEEKRQQRIQQEQENVVDLPVTDEASEGTEDLSPVEEITSEPQGAEVIDFPVEPSAVGEGYEHAEPLAVAAKVAADGNTDLGEPSPKIDKRLWTPKTVKELPLEGDESRNPTTRTDVAAQGYENTPLELAGIGENKTVTEKLPSVEDDAGFQSGGEEHGEGGTWTKGPATAVSSTHDPDKNELVEIMKSNYDGFLPQLEVQRIVASQKAVAAGDFDVERNFQAPPACPQCGTQTVNKAHLIGGNSAMCPQCDKTQINNAEQGYNEFARPF